MPPPCLFVCQVSLSIGALFTTTLSGTGSDIISSQMTVKSLLKPLKRNGSHAPHSPLTFFFWGGESMNHMKIPSEGGSKFDKLSKRKVMSGI